MRIQAGSQLWCRLIVISAWCSCPAVVLLAEPERGVYAESPDNKGLISAPVMYRETMLIAVTDQGVAAIVIWEKDPRFVNKGVEYRYRYLKNQNAAEENGSGRLMDTVNDKDKLTIKAGPIRIGWSGSAHDRGWIYYKPEEMQICIAKAGRFDDAVLKDGDNERSLEKLDLKRFLRKP